MPSSDRFSIERISELARIELNAETIVEAQQELSQVLQFVAVLDDLELSKVEPFFGMTHLGTNSKDSPQRNDQVQPSTPQEDILRNAPDQDGEFYHVPPVFG